MGEMIMSMLSRLAMPVALMMALTLNLVAVAGTNDIDHCTH
jgi:hypothetical protein